MTINNRRAFICGLKGFKLTKNEIKFLKKYKPWGIIIFSRNIKDFIQIKKLTNDIKSIFKDKNYPILIDEEGGKISRLKKLIDSSFFSQEFFGNLYKKDKKKFNLFYKIYIKQISYLLSSIGINVNNVPCLDLKIKNTHNIIGTRSYSNNKKIASKVGQFCVSEFKKNKIATIVKHIPGHGLAKVDSHLKLPVINKSIKYLKKNDFYPFCKTNSLFAMTAHIVFKKIDPVNPVTHSKIMINYIRKKIKFKKLLITDDISMKALKFSISKNTKLAFTAGCNIVLHCNANTNEMVKVAENSPIVNKYIIKKTSQLIKIIG